MTYPDLKPEHRYTAESMVKMWLERAQIEIFGDARARLVADIANELCAYERVGYGSGISDAKQKCAHEMTVTSGERFADIAEIVSDEERQGCTLIDDYNR